MSISSDNRAGFHTHMTRLELKLKQSEDERLYLEEKFNELLQTNKSGEAMQLYQLREEYCQLLERDRMRCDRNDDILRVLGRIESRTSALTAKTDRLRLLKHHYEACMKRNYSDWKTTEGKHPDALGSINDIHSIPVTAPTSSPSSRRSSISPSNRCTPTITLSRRSSLVGVHLEIPLPKPKFNSETNDEKQTGRKKLFGDSPRAKSFNYNKSTSFALPFSSSAIGGAAESQIPKVTINDNYVLSPLSVDLDLDQNTSNDLLQVSTSDDRLSEFSFGDKGDIPTKEITVSKENFSSKMDSINRKYEEPRVSRPTETNRTIRPTFRPQPRILSKSSSFNTASAHVQRPESCFSSERRSSIIRRPTFVYRSSIPPPVSRSVSPRGSVSSLPSYTRSKSPLGVVDDIFKKYLINYDKRYLSDPISESKYGKYLYPQKTREYDEINSSVFKSTNVYDPKLNNSSCGLSENDLYLFPRGVLPSDRFSSFGSNESLLSEPPKYRSYELDRFASPYKTDWKEWSHYRDRYEYSPGVQTKTTQTNSSYLDDLDYTRTIDTGLTDSFLYGNTNSPMSYTDHAKTYSKDLSSLQRAKPSIIKSPAEYPANGQYRINRHQNFSRYDDEETEKPEFDSYKKDYVKMPQTPKKVSFSNEFLYDDKSDPTISLNVDEVPNPPEIINNNNEPVVNTSFIPSLVENYETPGYESTIRSKSNERNMVFDLEKNKSEDEITSGKVNNVLEERHHVRDKADSEAKKTLVESPLVRSETDGLDSTTNEEKGEETPKVAENHGTVEESSILENTKTNMKRRNSVFPNTLTQDSNESYVQDVIDSPDTRLDEPSINESDVTVKKVGSSENLISEKESDNQTKDLSEPEMEPIKNIMNQEDKPDGEKENAQSKYPEEEKGDQKYIKYENRKISNEETNIIYQSEQSQNKDAGKGQNILNGKQDLKYDDEDQKQMDYTRNYDNDQIIQSSQENLPAHYDQDLKQQPFDIQDYGQKPHSGDESQVVQGAEFSEEQQSVYDNPPADQGAVPQEYTQSFQNEGAYVDPIPTEYGVDYTGSQYDQFQPQYDQYEQQQTEGYSTGEYPQQDTAEYEQPQQGYGTEEYSQENVPQEYQQPPQVYESDYREGEYQQQPVEYDENYAQEYQQPVSEQYQGEEFVQQDQYGKDYESKGGELYSPNHYQGKLNEQNYNAPQFEGEYPAEYTQQPVQYEEGYPDTAENPQDIPQSYEGDYNADYQNDPNYQYNQQQDIYDHTNMPEQYDQYQQPEQYQGEPDQYGNYGYGYDEEGKPVEQVYKGDDQQIYAGAPQEYVDNTGTAYDDNLQPPYEGEQQSYVGDQGTYGEGQDTYGDGQQYGSSGYLPQDVDVSNYKDTPPQHEYPTYGDSMQPNELQTNPEAAVYDDGIQQYPSAAQPSTSDAPANLNRVLESDSESTPVVAPAAVTHDDSSDFDFSSANK